MITPKGSKAIITPEGSKAIKRFIAFSFILLGISASLVNNLVAKKLCFLCIPKEEVITIFLFLFIEVIFIICGASLLFLEIYPAEIESK